VAEDGAAADDKVVGDGDGVGVGVGDRLGDSVNVGVGDGLGDSVNVGLDGPVAVGIGVGVSGRIDDRVGLGAVGVGASDCIGDRVGLGIVAVGVPGSIGDRVGLGIVTVGVGGEIAERDGVTDGRSGEPFPSHEMSNSAAAVRPIARITGRSEAAVSNPALVITSPFHMSRSAELPRALAAVERAVAHRERWNRLPAFRTRSGRHSGLVGQHRQVQPLADLSWLCQTGQSPTSIRSRQVP
jgi:hypothetical protein